MAFSPDELERYARHIVLPEIGGAGQQALRRAAVLVIGAGGLGAPLLLYLAAAGVGRLRIVDDDDVSLSNLQRQVIHRSDAVGRAKTASAREAVLALNPQVAVEEVRGRFTAASAPGLLAGVDVAADGSDNFATRYAAADACAAARVPLVTGAIGRFDGSLTVLEPWGARPDGRPNPGYRDVFPAAPPPGAVPSCAEAGVVGALPGVLGALMAMEVIKTITGAGDRLVGRLLLADTLSMRFETIEY
jgi:molybdopterin/thiamine biosynthesis adenylyltransferase